jgi:hypothetical protein
MTYIAFLLTKGLHWFNIMKKTFQIIYVAIALIGLTVLAVMGQKNDKSQIEIHNPPADVQPVSQPSGTTGASNSEPTQIKLMIKTEPYNLDCDALRTHNADLQAHLDDIFFQCTDQCLGKEGCDSRTVCRNLVQNELQNETEACVSQAMSNS